MTKPLLNTLLSRRSTAIKNLSAPGPDAAQIDAILTAASRVPDHGKLAPWWFVVFEGDARERFGAVLREAYRLEDEGAASAKLDLEAEKFLRAPVVIAVISRIRESKIPQWEQFLSAGAACFNLCLAAEAMGFGYNWVTGWPTFNARVRDSLGCDGRDNIAGFIYLGTQAEKSEERERPALTDIVSRWSEDYRPRKGEKYGKDGVGIPDAGVLIAGK